MTALIPTGADAQISECLNAKQSFALIAGAGAGKTSSLVTALNQIRDQMGLALRKNGQRIACITYTKRATEVIRSRLGFDELYHISTLHSFVWGEIGKFTEDLRGALKHHRIPMLIEKAREKDTGRDTQEARRAREQIARLEQDLAGLDAAPNITYGDSIYSNYQEGRLNHDDVIELGGYLLAERPALRRILGLRYPFIFVDEAQDTFQTIINGFNLVSGHDELPVVGLFGDPWQQIYEDNRAGNFAPPPGGQTITKTENFRCAPEIIKFLNAFRTDVMQVPAGANMHVKGSVELRLVRAEVPEGDRRRYSEPQVERALIALDNALDSWGWSGRDDVMRLFLVRQMIARRLGFSDLHKLFTGPFASAQAQEDYESGNHFLLRPFVQVLWPLLDAYEHGRSRQVIEILKGNSPAYDIAGPNATRPLKEMIDKSHTDLAGLAAVWKEGCVRDVLLYCRTNDLLFVSGRLQEQLSRPARTEEYDEAIYAEDKGDWLTDHFFAMSTEQLGVYSDFINQNTVYSTQHGVKGEEYPNVLVVFDDIEAAWNHYNFGKLLTPKTSGEPTEGQRERGTKLAYVCFSRAEQNLRILLFTQDPEAAREEVIGRGLLEADQIVIA